MSFWKSKSDKNLIPPVAEAPRDFARSNSYNNAPPPRPTYGSNHSDPSSRPALSASPNDGYSAPPRDRFGRGYPPGGDPPDEDQYGGASRFQRPAPRPEPEAGQEDEDDIEGIKQQTRFVKQDSVNSTRNALRMMREAEETARNTLGRLGDQSGKPVAEQ